MTQKPASNITNEAKDNVDKVVMKLMPMISDKIQEILTSPEHRDYVKVLYEEKMPVFPELLIVEVLMQLVDFQYKDFEKRMGTKRPEQLDPRNMVKRYLENPAISYATRWKLYQKEELN